MLEWVFTPSPTQRKGLRMDRRLPWFALSSVAVLQALAFSGVQASEIVIPITGESRFEEVVGASEYAVVMFYAPHCAHSQKLAPTLEDVAQTLGREFVFAKVDASDGANEGLAVKYAITKYPMLQMFLGGRTSEPAPYEGPRDKEGMIDYLTTPPAMYLSSADQVATFRRESDQPVVAYLEDAEGDAFERYSRSAFRFGHEYSFAYVLARAHLARAHPLFSYELHRGREDCLLATYDNSTLCPGNFCGGCQLSSRIPCLQVDCKFCRPGTAVAFNEFDNVHQSFHGYLDGMGDWLKVVMRPRVLPLGTDSPRAIRDLHDIFKPGAPPKIVGLSDGSDSSVEDALRQEEDKHMVDLVFLYGDTNKAPRALADFGVPASQLPAFVISHDTGNYHYFKADVKGLTKFIWNFLEGKLTPTPANVKSEPVPDEPYDDNVKVVVSQEFDQIVFSGKNVLLEFYAPWCGHCQQLAPVYAELGAKYRDDSSVEIAKIDATANDYPTQHFDVSGFPSIFLITGDRNIEEYTGSRSRESLSSFIQRHKTAVRSSHDEL